MPWPPTNIPPADLDNTVPMVDRHPSDHNDITDALRDVVAKLDDIEARLTAVEGP